ncbi:uncharacterized protein LOC143026983 [Oratosquilla oratoria]|uniref:uncharacterized protein LOC143026983 n=1 Tax=Oratosquilla oratoria TaxID=337810 RepID=UPI003F759106
MAGVAPPRTLYTDISTNTEALDSPGSAGGSSGAKPSSPEESSSSGQSNWFDTCSDPFQFDSPPSELSDDFASLEADREKFSPLHRQGIRSSLWVSNLRYADSEEEEEILGAATIRVQKPSPPAPSPPPPPPAGTPTDENVEGIRSFSVSPPKHRSPSPLINQTKRNGRVTRNPSYQAAVKDVVQLNTVSATRRSSHPSFVFREEETSTEVSWSEVKTGLIPTVCVEEETNPKNRLEAPVIIHRSVSDSESLLDTDRLFVRQDKSSVSEGNSRRSSCSDRLELGALDFVHRNLKQSPDSPERSQFLRNSSVTQSFRKIFNPRRRASVPAISDFSHEFNSNTKQEKEKNSLTNNNENNGRSSIRRLSSTLSRRLSFRSTKISASEMNSNNNNNNNNNNPTSSLVNGATSAEERSSGLVAYGDLLKLFKCPGCQTMMTPPLHQCRKGHLVCSSCRANLKHVCPVCKQRFSDNTNVMMEQVCHLMKFPCRFADQGCPDHHEPKYKADHEQFCSFRPVHCHFENLGCSVLLPLRDMQSHVEQCEFQDNK